MPNMCMNSIVVYGETEDINKVLDVEMDFQQLYPCPYIDTNGDSTDDKWREWCVSNWGTKWAADEIEFYNKSKDCFQARFLTAWAPSIEFFAYLTSVLPSLEVHLKYYEGGLEIAGESYIKNGKAITDELNFKDIETIREFLNDEFGYDIPVIDEELIQEVIQQNDLKISVTDTLIKTVNTAINEEFGITFDMCDASDFIIQYVTNNPVTN